MKQGTPILSASILTKYVCLFYFFLVLVVVVALYWPINWSILEYPE